MPPGDVVPLDEDPVDDDVRPLCTPRDFAGKSPRLGVRSGSRELDYTVAERPSSDDQVPGLSVLTQGGDYGALQQPRVLWGSRPCAAAQPAYHAPHPVRVDLAQELARHEAGEQPDPEAGRRGERDAQPVTVFVLDAYQSPSRGTGKPSWVQL